MKAKTPVNKVHLISFIFKFTRKVAIAGYLESQDVSSGWL